MNQSSDAGVDGFLQGLLNCGIEPLVDAGVVTFRVAPLAGRFSGRAIATGVGVEELSAWPVVPPHWVHFPEEVAFLRTNVQSSSKPGWNKHSREIRRWNNAEEPAQAWIAHVRAILGEAC